MMRIEKQYIEDTSLEWNQLLEELDEYGENVMIIGDSIFGNEFINFNEIEEILGQIENVLDNNYEPLEEEKIIDYLGWDWYDIDDLMQSFEYYTNLKTNEKDFIEAYKVWENRKNEFKRENVLEFINNASKNHIMIYESRGYSQGDYAEIIFDSKTVDIEFIEEIDAILWGKVIN